MPPTPMLLDAFGAPIPPVEKALQAPLYSGPGSGWYPIVNEPFAGAWQKNISINRESVLTFHAVFACMTLIASDIAKLRVMLVTLKDEIWVETSSPAFSPVLRKPNAYQNRIQFWESWILSKLSRGNTYVLKQRDNRGVVIGMHVLDPTRVKPMVSDVDGAVFYDLQTDYLSGVGIDHVVVPAREIIHDRFNCFFHPLCGLSPIAANGLAATQGKSIQMNSTWFFDNRSMPGGILTAPGVITETTAERLKTQWEENFGGRNVGKIAVLGDGLKFEKLPIVSALDAQLIDQLKWTSEVVCSTFHVPPYKIGVGALPSYNNVQALNVEYYTQCLQRLIEDAEICLDEGLGLGVDIGTEFDLDGLLRMDSASLMQTVRDGVGAGVVAPNEGRKKLSLPPVSGGESPYLQQQNYSLAALAKRDAQPDPFAKPGSPPPGGAQDDAGDGEDEEDAANENEQQQAAIAAFEERAGVRR